mmetsp:Transcript_32886/g.68662  ORF Transcript_32886/g.68662 Transcript_32886/m.68662 type:complete len:81 (-) Transcript_32886:70-312(-)
MDTAFCMSTSSLARGQRLGGGPATFWALAAEAETINTFWKTTKRPNIAPARVACRTAAIAGADVTPQQLAMQWQRKDVER